MMPVESMSRRMASQREENQKRRKREVLASMAALCRSMKSPDLWKARMLTMPCMSWWVGPS